MSKDDMQRYDEIINILTEIIKKSLYQEREVIQNESK